MAGSKKPRDKAYKPRLVSIPIMSELLRSFELQLRTQLQRIVTDGQVRDRTSLDALAEVFNVLILAYPEQMNTKEMLLFQTVMRWLINRQEQGKTAPVLHFMGRALMLGVNRMVQILKKADVTKLYVGMRIGRWQQK